MRRVERSRHSRASWHWPKAKSQPRYKRGTRPGTTKLRPIKLLRRLRQRCQKGIFCAYAGRQQKVIDEQADRYDLPIDGPTVDLNDAIRAYHDLITANARYIRPADDAELAENGELDLDEAQHHDLQTEKLRQEIIKLRQSNERLGIQVTRDRGDSIDRRHLREMLMWLSTRLEGFGQQLRTAANGSEAQKTLNEFLEHLADECEQGVLQI